MIGIKVKKLIGLVNLLIVLVNNLNKMKIKKAIPKGNIGRNIEKLMVFSIQD
tara:strand:- start:187 stop:342 length:156 start_codon:yes stop_codon:yes gene_type:complete